jgi:hypothetical protein
MTSSIRRLLDATTVAAGVTAAGYVGLVTGACPLDLGIGRRARPLGPQLVEVAAPREAVFDLIAEPYLGRAPRARCWPTTGRSPPTCGAWDQWWSELVGCRWEQTVAASLAAVKAEAERRAAASAAHRRLHGGRQRLRAANGVMSFGGYGERRHGSHQRARLAGPAWLPPADAACPPSAA